MQKKLRNALAIVLSVLLLCGMLPLAASVTAEAEKVNLIKNGDFETGDTANWNTYQGSGVEAAAAKNGSYGAHIKGNGGWGGMLNQTIDGLEVGKTYRFSFMYKTNSSGVNVKLTAGTHDQGAQYGYIYCTKNVWSDYAVEFEAVDTTAFINLCGSGTGAAEDMYIDDISVTEVVLGGDDSDPNLKMIDTLLDNVKIQGRTAMVGGTLMLDFSISGIEFELDCEGDVYATFNARKLSSTSSTGGAYFTIVVDGEKKARDYCHITTIGETKVKLAEGLSKGKHTFAIYRQTEHSQAEIGVCALSYDGEILAKPADKDLYIEFIGDSISCGFGNLGNSSQGDGAPLWSDGSQAYTFLTAQALNADWSNVSWSGLGCKYGYSSTTMQQVYPAQRYNYDKNTQYDFSAKKPDVIVLALGTNDNAKAPDNVSKRAGMVEMLTLVRAKNPDVPIVWIYNMMTNGVNAMVEEIVEEFGGADKGYYACKLTMNTSGGGWHPNLKGQQKFADELVAFLGENILNDLQHPTADLISGGKTSRMEMTEYRLGLAFEFSIDASGVVKGGDYVADLTNATVKAEGGNSEFKLLSMGALMSNDVTVGLSPEKMTMENLSDKTIAINAEYVSAADEDSATFAVRITNIPTKYSEAAVFVRPYYVYERYGQPVVVYDSIVYDNYAGNIDINDGFLDWTPVG